MAIGVFGDTQSFNYNFLTKVSGSTAECPLKVYEANIPSAQTPYAPTDVRWKEITDQSILDSLRYQDSLYKALSVSASLDGTPVGDAMNNYVVRHNATADGTMNVELEGNTLVNLSPNISTWNKGGFTTTISGNEITINGGYASNSAVYSNKFSVKPNTVYTYIATVNKIPNAGTAYFDWIEFDNTNTQTIDGDFTGSVEIINATNGIGAKTFKFTTLSNSTQVSLRIVVNTDVLSGDSLKVDNIMCLEGDWTSKPLPSYFDGVKNVDTFDVKSIGKNLINPLTVKAGYINALGNGTEGGSADTTLVYNDSTKTFSVTTTTSADRGLYTDYIFVKSSTNYTLSLIENYTVYVCKFDKNKNYLGSINNKSFTMSADVSYIRIYVVSNKAITTSSVTNLMLEYGTTATTYEAYKESKKTITLTNGINRLPNGTFDTITSDGRVQRKTGKVVLNGSESWSVVGTTMTNTIEFQYNSSFIKASNSNDDIGCISDKVLSNSANYLWNNDVEGVGINILGYIQLRIAKSKLSTQDVAGFKTWLTSNNTTVYYELKTPTEETTTALSLSSYKGGNLIVDTTIPPYVREWHTDSTTSVTSATSKFTKAMMVEVDLSAVANGLYGGSNASLKSGSKKINVDMWSSGSGSNSGVLTSDCRFGLYTNGSAWEQWWSVNALNTINKLTNSTANSSWYIQTSNKIYILCSSQFSSDQNIPSTLNVDYIQVRVDFTRTKDLPQGIELTV